MTVPYLKTIGEEIGPSLQQLGQGIQDIVMPNRKYELYLKEAIAKDPTLLGKLATVEKDNPGALSRVFGPNAGSFLGQLQETPDAQLHRQITQVSQGLTGRRGDDIGAAALGIDSDVVSANRQAQLEGQSIQNEGGQLSNESNKLNLDKQRTYAQFFNSLPKELQNDAFFTEQFKMPKSEYDNMQRRASNMKNAEGIAKMGTPELMQGFLSGQINSDQIQGWIDLNPQSSKAMLDLLAMDKEARLRRELAKTASKDNRRDFMQAIYLQTAKEAAALGVPAPALFKYQTGIDPSQAVPEFIGTPVDNEGMKAAGEAYQRQIQADRAKTLKPVSTALAAFNTSPDVGTAAALTAAFQSADIPIEAVWDTNWLNEKKFFMTMPDGTKKEIDSDTVSQLMNNGGKAPGSDKITSNTIPAAGSGGGTSPATPGQNANVSKLLAFGKSKNLPLAEIKKLQVYASLSDNEKKFIDQEYLGRNTK